MPQDAIMGRGGGGGGGGGVGGGSKYSRILNMLGFCIFKRYARF